MSADQSLIDRIRAVRRELADDGPPAVRSEGAFERVAIPVSDANALRDLIAGEGPHVVIEIGLADGSSALAIG